VAVIAVGTSDFALPVLVVRVVGMVAADVEATSEVERLVAEDSELLEPVKLVELVEPDTLVDVLELKKPVSEVGPTELDKLDEELESNEVLVLLALPIIAVLLELSEEVKPKVAVVDEPTAEEFCDDGALVPVGTTKVITVVPSVEYCWAPSGELVEDSTVEVVELRLVDDVEFEVGVRSVLPANCEEGAEGELAVAS
jgi:hypothetical protein